MFSNLIYIKLAAKLVTGAGVSKVVRDIIQNNTTTPTSPLNGFLMGVGTVVLGSMISDVAWEHVDAKIDNFVTDFDSIKEKTETIK